MVSPARSESNSKCPEQTLQIHRVQLPDGPLLVLITMNNASSRDQCRAWRSGGKPASAAYKCGGLRGLSPLCVGIYVWQDPHSTLDHPSTQKAPARPGAPALLDLEGRSQRY